MNRSILSGRLSRDPEFRYTGDLGIAKFTLAVDRKVKKGEPKQADFINITCFGSLATFVEKYFHKGDGMNLEGRIQTGSYKNREGKTVFTTDIIAESIEFPLSNKGGNSQATQKPETTQNDFMSIPEGIEDELPFN